VIVVGVLVPASSGSARSADSVVEIARRAAATGARTEIVGLAPTGADGDRLLVELAAAGIGHATVTRSTAGGIEAADLDLALRYLPDVRAIVLSRPTASLLEPAIAAASWSGATLIVLATRDSGELAGVAAGDDASPGDGTSPRRDPIILEPPSDDPDGAFAGVVAALAVRLDAGEDPKAAWQSTVAALAIDPA
jgi:hypothetical protein